MFQRCESSSATRILKLEARAIVTINESLVAQVSPGVFIQPIFENGLLRAPRRNFYETRDSRPRSDCEEATEAARQTGSHQPKKIKLADAIEYPSCVGIGLSRFIDDGCIELDNYTVQRLIRGIMLQSQNAPLAGSEAPSTGLSLRPRQQIKNTDPLAYLTDVLTRIVNWYPNRDIKQGHSVVESSLRSKRTLIREAGRPRPKQAHGSP